MNYPEMAIITKLVVLAVLCVVGVFRLVAPADLYRRFRVLVVSVLLVSLVFGILGFFHYMHFLGGRFNNYHDVYHYYFGSKYSAELGYSDLYKCTLMAEIDGKETLSSYFLKSQIRLMDTYEHVPVEQVLDEVRACKTNFSPERWEQFTTDLRDYRRIFNLRSMKSRLKDMGYNATPVWNMVGNWVADVVPVTRWGLIGLGLIDVVLLTFAFVVVGLTFGLEAGLITAIFFLTLYPLQRLFIHGSMLRFDWMVCIILSICMLKRGFYKLSGGLMAYSAMVRVFPVLFLFGPGVKFLYILWKERRVDRRLLSLGLSFAVTAVVLAGLSIWHMDGLGQWESFIGKITVHNQSLTTTRIGLKYVMMYEGETSRKDFKKLAGSMGWNALFDHKREVLKERRPVQFALIGLLVLALAFVVRRLDDYEALAIGYPLIFLLLGPTIYYSQSVAALCILLVTRPGNKLYAYNFAVLTAVMCLSFVLTLAIPWGHLRHFWVSLMYLVMIVVLLGTFLYDDPKARSVIDRLLRRKPRTPPIESPPDSLA